MPGFMSSNTAMIICELKEPVKMDVEKLRKGAFCDVIDPNGRRFGWTGLGELLDTENFFLALSDARFSGFSFRQDMRKPSAAVARLQLAEKIREEEQAGRKVGAKRKKELREAIMAKLTSEAEFVPSLIDCIWDNEKGRLFVGAGSEKAAQPLLDHFKSAFGADAIPIGPEKDMSEVFSVIQRTQSINAAGFDLSPTGDASLVSAGEDKSAIAAQNNAAAIEKGLTDGLAITKISMEASRDEESLFFSLNEDLYVTGLRLPKPERGSDQEATFLINAEICATVADIVEELSTFQDS